MKWDVLMVIMDGCHRQHAVRLLKKERGCSWTEERFCGRTFLGISQLKISALYVTEPQIFWLPVEETHSYITNYSKPITFHVTPYYATARADLLVLPDLY